MYPSTHVCVYDSMHADVNTHSHRHTPIALFVFQQIKLVSLRLQPGCACDRRWKLLGLLKEHFSDLMNFFDLRLDVHD